MVGFYEEKLLLTTDTGDGRVLCDLRNAASWIFLLSDSILIFTHLPSYLTYKSCILKIWNLNKIGNVFEFQLNQLYYVYESLSHSLLLWASAFSREGGAVRWSGILNRIMFESWMYHFVTGRQRRAYWVLAI